MRQPVACSTPQRVRTSREAFEAAALGVEELHARLGRPGTALIQN